MTSYDSMADFDDIQFPSDSVDYQTQAKYANPKGKLQKPRRNRSAFIIFSSETRAKLKLDDGSLNSNEMMVKLAELWKNLSNDERERYENLAKEDRQRYQQELIEFTKYNPTETIQNKTKNNHVKKPCSAYGIFLKERKDVIKNQHAEYKMADILKIVSQEWKNLPEDQKQTYQNKANTEKEVVQTKISEAIARDQVAQDSLQPKNKDKRKQMKLNPGEEFLDGSVQPEISPLFNNRNQVLPKAMPRVGETLYLPMQSHSGLPEGYPKQDYAEDVRAALSNNYPRQNMNPMMHMNNLANRNQVNNLVNHNMRQPQNPVMMANNFLNMGMRMPQQMASDSFLGGAPQYQMQQQINNALSQQINQQMRQQMTPQMNQQLTYQPNYMQPQQKNYPANYAINQQLNSHVNHAMNLPTNNHANQTVNHQVKPQSFQPDMKLFNNFMENFPASDFLFDDPLFEKGDF